MFTKRTVQIILLFTMNMLASQNYDSIAISFVENSLRVTKSNEIKYSNICFRRNIHIIKEVIPMDFFMPFFSSLSITQDSCYQLVSNRTSIFDSLTISCSVIDSIYNSDSILNFNFYKFRKISDDNSKNRVKNVYIRKLNNNLYLFYRGSEHFNYLPYNPVMGTVAYLMLYIDARERIHYLFKYIKIN